MSEQSTVSTTENTKNWSMVIKPKRNLLDVNLKELWAYRDLIILFVRRDFVAAYKQTILGPIWFLIPPIISTITYSVIFGDIANISTDGLPKILFYMSGIVGWKYFSSSLTATSNTFLANAGIFGKVYFPRLVIPISTVISGLIQFAIQFALLLVIMVFFKLNGADFSPDIHILLLPLLIILMAGLGLGFGVLISSLTTKYRDIKNLVGFGMQLWMYVTPIIYPLSELDEKYRTLALLNPLTPVIETFRFALFGRGTFDVMHLTYSFVFMIVLLIIGVLTFNKVEQSFMDTV